MTASRSTPARRSTSSASTSSLSRTDALRARSRALAAIRAFFHERDFVEIEPTLAVQHPGMELHIDAVPVGERYLITSPEYQMKRLLCEGFERIYALCRCFRGGEQGIHHSVEFTMLEWYRGHSNLAAIQADTEALVGDVARAVRGEAVATVAGRDISLEPPFEVVSVRELVAKHIGIDLAGDESAEALRRKLEQVGVDVGTAARWDDVFYTAFLDRVEPAIEAMERPVFVVDWPVRLGALARPKAEDPRLVERFELYVGGVELANAFGELTDAVEQRRRFAAEQHERREAKRPVYDMDERFLAALESGMPDSGGIALGVDRLVMVATGANDIAEVQAFPAATV